MGIKHTLGCAALAVLCTTAARAQETKPPLMTVQKLYIKYCMAESPDYSVCAAYIGGVADEMRQIGMLVRTLPTGTPITVVRALAPEAICGDYTATNGDEVQAFKNWAQPNPKYWAEPAYSGVVAALTSMWPCAIPK